MTATLAPPPARRTAPPRELPTLGPHAHGERFTWEEYERALEAGDYDPDCFFELSRGVLVVVGMPNLWHGQAIRRVRRRIERWDDAHPGVITFSGGGGECRLAMRPPASDRHPDYSVYTTPEPHGDSRAWFEWAPTLVVEVVTRGSRRRDHGVKADDYLAFGVGEYWILDPNHPDRPGPSARVLTRNAAGDGWDERWEDGVVTSARFPGLEVPVAEVLAGVPAEELAEAGGSAADAPG